MEVLIYIAKSAGILASFYLVYRLALHKDTFFTANRHYLLLGVAAAILLPMLEFTKTTYITASSVPILTSLETIPTEATTVVSEKSELSWQDVLMSLYCIGFLFMLVRMLVQLRTLHILIKQHPSTKVDGYHYVEIDRDLPPFSFFSYIFYNPCLHTTTELNMILQHERVHAAQWHSLDVLCSTLLVAFQWANPFAWWYKKGVEQNLEFIADSETAQQVSSKKQYQLALVKASSTAPIPALTTNFYQSFIKKRIIMLNKSTTKSKNVWKLCLILPVLAVFLYSFNVKEEVIYKNSTAQEMNATPSEIFSSESSASKKVTVENSTGMPSESDLSTSTSEANNTNLSLQPTGKWMEAVSEATQETRDIAVKDIYIRITKNTTRDALAKHKERLKSEHQIDFEYSDLTFNSAGELTGISISYNDPNGSRGNYELHGDEPIEDFYLHITEDGSFSFGSEVSNEFSEEREIEIRERAKARMDRQQARLENRKVALEERKEERIEVRKEMQLEREDARKARSKERARLRVIHKDHEIHEDHEEIVYVDRERSRARGNTFVYANGGQNRFVHRDVHSGDHTVIIDKNTTDADLQQLKEQLAEKDISFTFKKVKRNKHNEITGIRIDIKDSVGGKRTTSIKSDDDEPIETIVLNM